LFKTHPGLIFIPTTQRAIFFKCNFIL